MMVDRTKAQELLQLAKSDALKALSLFKACDNEFYYDPEVITKSIEYVMEDQLGKAVALITDLKDEWTKQIALSELALHAASYDISTAIEVANLCDSHYKPQTLASIATDMIKIDIDAAKKITQSIEHFPSQVGVLALIASCFKDEEGINELLQVVEMKERFGDGCDTDEALDNIAWRIAYNFPDKAIKLLKKIRVNQEDAITRVALNLKDTDRGIELIRTSLSDDGFPQLSSALGMMALMVSKTDRKKAMELIGEMQDEEEKDEVLFSLR